MEKLTIQKIDTSKCEGQYLLAAVAMLTTMPPYTSNTPDQVMDIIYEMAIQMAPSSIKIDEPPKEQLTKREVLVRKIAEAINSVSAENGSNTPDFMLAELLVSTLETFNVTIKNRENWYGVSLSPLKKLVTSESGENYDIDKLVSFRDTNIGLYATDKKIEDLLYLFWQRSSDACPLEVREAEKQEEEFRNWVKNISFVIK